MTARLKTTRRYYLHKRKASLLVGEGITSLWHHKQDSEPGTSLPSTFPALTKLATAFYSTVEDLDGADAAELTAPVTTGAGLTRQESTAVLSALQPLLT